MLEFKRSINNRSFIFCFLTVLISFILGYILLISIDKIEVVTLKQLYFSVYTVFTQFGIMIFSIVILYSINLDYKEKNILFYQAIGINAKKYFLNKLSVMLLWFSCAIFIAMFTVCSIYKDFSDFLVMLIYFENVIIYTLLISSLLGYIFKNILVAFGMNLFIWLGSIIIYTIFPNCKYIAYFDASNILYLNFEKYIDSGRLEYLQIWESFLYNILLFIFVLSLVCIFSKRWIKNGI